MIGKKMCGPALLGIVFVAYAAVVLAQTSAPEGSPQTPSNPPAQTVEPPAATPPAPTAEQPAASPPAPAPAAAAGGASGTMTPLERVAATPKGELKNPFTDKEDAIAEGKKLYFSYSCNGCHGGNGGGGMCPPLSNVVWVYGSDDDTMFRLIAEGTDVLRGHGYSRKGRENVVGPMPPFGELIPTDDELWKIIAFVRTTYRGDPSRRNW
jgi:mono/diheme cytochrome c family protein